MVSDLWDAEEVEYQLGALVVLEQEPGIGGKLFIENRLKVPKVDFSSSELKASSLIPKRFMVF